MTASPSSGSGVVVLAAYRPDPDLFRIQLETIRDQTRRDWTCLVGADGDVEEVGRLVDEVVGDDERFRVVGWVDNVGFYRNFERLLASVPAEASWVALSDQDDRWYAEKLERLVPLLDAFPLATGQARIVRWPEEQVVLERTARRVVAPEDLLLQNHVSGALSVLRRDLLDTALPFPRLHTVTQLHDHWLAMCAAATGGYTVLDEVVQDYVQHGANAVGESAAERGMTRSGALSLWTRLADEYEGGHRPGQLLRAGRLLSFGWRRAMLTSLLARLGGPGDLPPRAVELAMPGRLHTFRVMVRAARSPDVTASTLATFIAGLPAELVRPVGKPE